MEMIVAKNIIFDYPNTRALKGVSFSIPQGSVVALVGPNGAGKTTLMRCVAALETPLFGSIHVDGADVITNPRECHKKIGYLSDFFGIYDDLTVFQHLSYIAEAHGVSDPANCIKNVLADVELERYINTPANELSRGWRQRLGIAMAIIHQPKVLILDEPASGLDPEARAHLSKLFIHLNQQGMTILSSSHILAELSEYSSHMMVIEQGKVIAMKSVGEGEKMQDVYMETIKKYRESQSHES